MSATFLLHNLLRSMQQSLPISFLLCVHVDVVVLLDYHHWISQYAADSTTIHLFYYDAGDDVDM
jgi:hypothetical protein